MAFLQSALSNFQQAIQTPQVNPLGIFLRGILERHNQLLQLREQADLQVRTAVETKKQTLPLETAEAGAKAKAQAEAFKSALGGGLPGMGAGGKGFPVGSKMSLSSTGEMGLDVPLNPSLTQDESTILGLAPDVDVALGQMEQAIPSVGNLMKGAIRLGAGMPFPYMVTGGVSALAGLEPEQQDAVSKLQSAFMFLRGTIPFQFGGKQLTSQERKIIESILDPTGKSLEVATADLQRYRRVFARISNAIRNGTIGAEDDLAKANLTRQALRDEGLLSSSTASNSFASQLPDGFSEY